MTAHEEWPEFDLHPLFTAENVDPNPRLVEELVRLHRHEYDRARVCVNTCAGMEDEDLALATYEELLESHRAHEQRCREFEQQNAELLASMKAAANWIRNCSTPLDAACELEKAIAKAGAA